MKLKITEIKRMNEKKQRKDKCCKTGKLINVKLLMSKQNANRCFYSFLLFLCQVLFYTRFTVIRV